MKSFLHKDQRKASYSEAEKEGREEEIRECVQRSQAEITNHVLGIANTAIWNVLKRKEPRCTNNQTSNTLAEEKQQQLMEESCEKKNKK